jgi:hypothetical protein
MQTPLSWPIVIVSFFLLQMLVSGWVRIVTDSWPLAAAAFFMPPVGIPLSLWKMGDRVKDNQVAGALTYVGFYAGIAFLTWKLPVDEVPWAVIYTMIMFAFVGVLNLIDIAVRMRS